MTLPDGWREVRLGEVADTALGKMLDRGRTRGLPEVRYLRNVNVQWGRIDTHDLLTMELDDDDRARFGVEPGDVLVCEGGEIGRAAIWQGDGEYIAFQKALHRIRPHAELDSIYLRYALEWCAIDGTFKRFSTGSTIAHLPQQQLRLVPFPLPPLYEQQQIVRTLEEHLSRIAAADRALSLMQQRLAAVAAASADRLAHADGVPMRLGELGPVITGTTPATRDGCAFNGDVWFVTPSDLGRGDHLTTATRVVSREAASRRLLSAGSVLVVCIGATIGKVGWSDRPLTCNQQINALQVNSLLASPEYVASLLTSPKVQRSILSSASNTTMPILNKSRFMEIQVAIPPLEHQTTLLAAHLEIRRESNRVRSAAELGARRSAALRCALLQAAFSGNLTGHASDLDRAEELVSA